MQKVKGFSLIELSISLAIVGLVFGGVLKGVVLLETAKIKFLVKQIEKYQMAVLSFEDMYHGLPGDFDQAQELIHPLLQNGNGNFILEGQGLAKGGAKEAVYFWSHLAGAGLIGDVKMVANQQDIQFGHGIPKTKFGGGITIENNPTPQMPGLWFIVGSQKGERGTGALLNPYQAKRILESMGERDPLEGRVRITEGQGILKGKCLKDGYFNLSEKNPTCTIYVQVNH